MKNKAIVLDKKKEKLISHKISKKNYSNNRSNTNQIILNPLLFKLVNKILNQNQIVITSKKYKHHKILKKFSNHKQL